MKFLLVLSIIFIILTFIGAGYVLYNNGQVNAGYAIIPMMMSLAATLWYRKSKQGKGK